MGAFGAIFERFGRGIVAAAVACPQRGLDYFLISYSLKLSKFLCLWVFEYIRIYLELG